MVGHQPATTGHSASAGPAAAAGTPAVDCASPEDLTSLVTAGPRTAAVIMTHHYERDLEYLGALLSTSVEYIGLLGPRRRSARMLADLSQRDPHLAISQRDRLFGPAGLDLGGDDPEMVALAIIAEVAAVMNRRSGTHLRDRAEPIHDDAPAGKIKSPADNFLDARAESGTGSGTGNGTGSGTAGAGTPSR